MKIPTLVAVLLLGSTMLFAGNPPGKGAAGFEKLKGMAGVWEGKDKDGKPVHISYKVVSGGSAVMETLGMAQHNESMITMYHLDGDQLMMTHYCAAGNQPRMRADQNSSTENQLNFSFIDATNMATPDDAHMHSLSIAIKDKNHFVQEWTFREKGKDGPPKVFTFVRKK